MPSEICVFPGNNSQTGSWNPSSVFRSAVMAAKNAGLGGTSGTSTTCVESRGNSQWEVPTNICGNIISYQLRQRWFWNTPDQTMWSLKSMQDLWAKIVGRVCWAKYICTWVNKLDNYSTSARRIMSLFKFPYSTIMLRVVYWRERYNQKLYVKWYGQQYEFTCILTRW